MQVINSKVYIRFLYRNVLGLFWKCSLVIFYCCNAISISSSSIIIKILVTLSVFCTVVQINLLPTVEFLVQTRKAPMMILKFIYQHQIQKNWQMCKLGDFYLFYTLAEWFELLGRVINVIYSSLHALDTSACLRLLLITFQPPTATEWRELTFLLL